MENSLCDDYISEKFFIILQEYNTVREHLKEKKRFLLSILHHLNPPFPPFGQVVQLFLDVKNNTLAHITKPSKND